MTIKIEREAVLYVLRGASDKPSAADCHVVDDVREPVFDSREELSSIWETSWPIATEEVLDGDACSHVQDVPLCDSAIARDLDSVSLSDDEVSLCSSTSDDSLSSTSSRKRVTFADDLVTDIRTRPRTPTEDLADLFYTSEETQRFRIEYRLERKFQTVDDASPSQEDSDSSEDCAQVDLISNKFRHRISHVVVLHEDKESTFYNLEEASCNKDASKKGDFFDNDSFWSGSITWF